MFVNAFTLNNDCSPQTLIDCIDHYISRESDNFCHICVDTTLLSHHLLDANSHHICNCVVCQRLLCRYANGAQEVCTSSSCTGSYALHSRVFKQIAERLAELHDKIELRYQM